jgi:hypothetical protein
VLALTAGAILVTWGYTITGGLHLTVILGAALLLLGLIAASYGRLRNDVRLPIRPAS